MLLAPIAITLALAGPPGSLTDGDVGAAAGEEPVLLDVPYLPQTEALCGGAAVAMVLRYWGDRRATVEEFGALVDPRAGGIADHVLIAAVRNRGWIAVQLNASLEAIRDRIHAGQPPILLLEDRPGRYHYVVAVGVGDRDVFLHDPVKGPLRRLPIPEFLEIWRPSQYWALLVRPDPSQTIGIANAAAVRSPVPPREPTCVGARCPDDSRVISELAGVRFAERRWAEAAALAEHATALDPFDDYAWDVLGSSRFLEDEVHGALDAWNHIGRPRVDHVRIEGLTRTHYALVADALALKPGALLTPHSFGLAERRLDELPTRASARIDYRPDAEGFAVVDVGLVEHSLLPAGWMAWTILGMRSAVTREVGMTVPGPTGQGEAWSAEWRWWKERPRIGLALAVPRAGKWPGIWRVDAFKESQTYALTRDTATFRETQTHVGLSVANWLTSSTRYQASAGFDTWDEKRRALSFGGTLEKRFLGDKLGASGSLRLWMPIAGGSAFQSYNLHASARSSTERAGWVHHAGGGIDAATAAAPPAVWSGAGSGQGRERLLRAHPLLRHGVIAGPVFGRRVEYVNLETRRWLKRPALPAVAVAAFADMASASYRTPPSSGSLFHVDAGVGLRVSLPGHDGMLRVDYGRGLRDGADAVTVGWEF